MASPAGLPAMDLNSIAEAYASGSTSPTRLVTALYPYLAAAKGMFIHLAPLEQLLARAAALEAQPADSRGSLWGVPFATKDNVDVAGMPTTAACPSFSYVPEKSAAAVQALEDAGGINFGKTNLDQFACGLVGTRTPYGAAYNAFDNRFIPGGSSSGGAAAVGGGLLCFAVGTDTGGSGRVPAGYNGCVGLKGTPGKISTVGVVPACASLDCLTVFARSVADGGAVFKVMESADAGAEDVWRRTNPQTGTAAAEASLAAPQSFKFGVPGPDFLDWNGPGGPEMAAASAATFSAAVARMEVCGGTRVDIDFKPFADAAVLLFQSSIVAERYSGLRAFLDKPGQEQAAAAAEASGDAAAAALVQQRSLLSDERLLPVTRTIIAGAGKFTAADAFDDKARLAVLAAAARQQLAAVDCLLVPTVLEHYLIQEIADTEDAKPTPSWPRNAKNGRFTSFVNLLDMCGIAIPSGLLQVDYASPAAAAGAQQRVERLTASGGPLRVALPFGVTLLAKAWSDEWLWGVAAAMETAAGLHCGPAGHGVEPVVVNRR